MQLPTTLTELLKSSELRYRWFNLGRGLRNLSNDEFEQFENAEAPYPWPVVRQAWMALLLWNPQDDRQHNIWFLKLPLDEQGLVVPSARDGLLAELLASLGFETGRPMKDKKDSPFTFKPRDEQRAIVHARVSHILAEAPNQGFDQVLRYLESPQESWAGLSVQALADIVERKKHKRYEALLIEALPRVPAAVFEALCMNLASQKIEGQLSKVITERLLQSLTDENLPESFFASAVAALGQSDAKGLCLDTIAQLLDTDQGKQPLVLQHLALYSWKWLQENNLMAHFMENLAICEGSDAIFAPIIADLMFVPGVRPYVLSVFRSPDRSDALTQAIGKMLGR